jgi:hypothetical protein
MATLGELIKLIGAVTEVPDATVTQQKTYSDSAASDA